MRACVLFSGGKDSALAAIMLSPHYEVDLTTFVFAPDRDVCGVKRAAEALGLPFSVRVFEEGILDDAVNRAIQDGFPNNALNLVHGRAIHQLVRDYEVVADGTRLNDKVPKLTRAEVTRLSDLYGCSYVRPLLGYGAREVARLAARYLVVQHGETGEIENGDYEGEIREGLMKAGVDPSSVFPPRHGQSLVIDRVDRGQPQTSINK
ncbi:MAG: alpha hydrolase [Methanomicrobiales archaeon]|jgi:hypothetical protein|nr:alpha hydrolase [Methanomicrobiales archaeon]